MQAIRVYSLEADAVVFCSLFPYSDTVHSLRWAAHDECTLLAAAGSTVAYWPYKQTGEWKALDSFPATITCMQQSATEPRMLAVGCADASLHLFDMLPHRVRREGQFGAQAAADAACRHQTPLCWPGFCNPIL